MIRVGICRCAWGKTFPGNGDGGRKADFYVTPSGDVVPSMGYRYMDSKYAEQTMDSMNAPGLISDLKSIIQLVLPRMVSKSHQNGVTVN